MLDYGSGLTPIFIAVRGFLAIFFFGLGLRFLRSSFNFAYSSTEESSAVRMSCILGLEYIKILNNVIFQLSGHLDNISLLTLLLE